MKIPTINISKVKTDIVSDIKTHLSKGNYPDDEFIYYDNNFNNNEKIKIKATKRNITLVDGYYVPSKKILLTLSRENRSFFVKVENINEAIELIKTYKNGNYKVFNNIKTISEKWRK